MDSLSLSEVFFHGPWKKADECPLVIYRRQFSHSLHTSESRISAEPLISDDATMPAVMIIYLAVCTLHTSQTGALLREVWEAKPRPVR